jgi:hypothetical protein
VTRQRAARSLNTRHVGRADAALAQSAYFTPKMRLISPKNGSFFGSFYKISNTWFGPTPIYSDEGSARAGFEEMKVGSV